ncbi:MAG: PHP domain-containing protein [candidate division WOR-3 bacterium]
MLRCDLHLHTTKSDGLYTPKDLVYFLYTKGIKIISITDHDSIEGINEAQEEAEKLGIEVITGIELSAEHKGQEVHILGYFIDINSPDLLNYLRVFREARKERFVKMIEKLRSMGIELSVDVAKFDEKQSIGRPHVAKEMVEKGYVSSIEEAFAKYIGDGGPAYVKKFKISIKEAIDIIHNSQGVAVLAHPGLLNNMEDVINLALQSGLDGIEVYHPKNPEYIENILFEIAFKNNLMITGGTDFHGTLDEKGYFEGFEVYCEIDGKRIKVRR